MIDGMLRSLFLLSGSSYIDKSSICQLLSSTSLDHEESVIVLSDTAVCGKVRKSSDKRLVSLSFIGFGVSLSLSLSVS